MTESSDTERTIQVGLTIRDLDAADLAHLDWSGGQQHIQAVATALQASYVGEVELLVIALPNGQLIAMGAVDYRKSAAAGELWMLAVDGTWQSLGVGSVLIAALERRISDHGISVAKIGVEHDNPRAAALYRRLGYRTIAAALDEWPVAGGATYVTVCAVMEKVLPS